ncbi:MULTISPECIES: DEAD/DEAH box helicase [Paenarthrobacter]|jgi:predicted helicase|uniref:Helicase n=1 Tax=Paenarthrobacter aurescens (strain TC1) TaxID=290340 RepID=A1RD21_PAEAT|nr:MULTISPECIES: DEAD/DEAH box helicase [Paenarthrobacter]ABM10457.1 putative Helicase [Paenarthrobacter aurescens TC1]MCY0975537.1 DEAD/DEAH box helicase [Paenarthrobacter ureafaciens]
MASSPFAALLDRLYFTASDERDKGSRFERLIRSYLQLDPQYAEQFSDVWLWDEWPGRDGHVDTGIDLVAAERDTGDLVAIQCKFYDPARPLRKEQIDSFFTAAGKKEFSRGLIVSTSDKWSKHAEDALRGQSKPVSRLRFQDLEDSTIDWSTFDLDQPEEMERKDKKRPRPHQRAAIEKVREGFQAHDRGKLIMACGTGKTYTSLRIVEDMVPVGGSVLFLVPSISLLQQTLTEWTAESEVPLRPLAVCSDTKVGKNHEDLSAHDLAFPASTDSQKLYSRSRKSTGQAAVTVVFSTYQSIDVVAQAQGLGLGEFDLIVCDEAHRTTGLTQGDDDDSAFVRVHDQDFIKAKKRLYMTATPRIYVQESKTKAAENDVKVFSMDDEAAYGPEFHHLGFGEAVERNLLSDYKVLVLAVNEESVNKTFQQLLTDDNNELNLDDVAKIVGCWNGLAKRGVDQSRLEVTGAPMKRAVAFAQNIKESKKIASMFAEVTDQLAHEHEGSLRCEGEHVDGTFNVLERNEKLDWLKADTASNQDGDVCRVLSNARCLSEGVDVPALDAVLFLNPRNSQVDVVQSVGRVMRKAEGKEYGYIILPIGVPTDMAPEEALKDNRKYKVVWDVLQALRAHDDRFNAMINKIELNKAKDDKLQIIGVGGEGRNVDGQDGTAPDGAGTQTMLHFPNLEEWRNAIYARIVRKVGDRRYWEDWAKDVKDIAERHTLRIRGILDDPASGVQDAFGQFLDGLRGNLNESITRDDAVDMLSQHLITKPVFDALFENYSFAAHNPVSRVMENMLEKLRGKSLETETAALEKFYASVRMRAEGIDNAEGKQKIITELYEKFFKLAFPRAAESLGIVYTPVEVVDFIIRSVDDVLRSEFGASLTDRGVHVLDPFTGTGTFIVRLLQSGLIRPEDLLYKYTNDLHANEILLLAYYIAAINIEATLHGLLTEQDPEAGYVPFDGIVLTDTFQMTEDDDTLDNVIFPQNNERAAHQKALDIRVIVGNPPYSVGQGSQNDANANLKYPTLDASIERTYAARSRAALKRNLYDSYIRAIRWASNRLETSKHGGIVAYVSNGGYIDSNTADGLRKTLADEFHSIYIYNLRGNQRTAGELSRKEGGKIFGSGSRNTVAVMILVKKAGASGGATVHYRDIGDYLTREEKLAIVQESTVASVNWQRIIPNVEGDWINQRNAAFDRFTPVGDKSKGTPAIFANYSLGLVTARDAWVYNYSSETVENNVKRMIEFYNHQVDLYAKAVSSNSATSQSRSIDELIDRDPTKFSWDRSDKSRLPRGIKYGYEPGGAYVSLYRPFSKQNVHFSRQLNNCVYQLPALFPDSQTKNLGFYCVGMGSAVPFSVLATNVLPNLHVTGAGSGGQFFSRYTYQPRPSGEDLLSQLASTSKTDQPEQVDNITDDALQEYSTFYGGGVSKDDIFYYVYGILHSPEYRAEFASDLQKMLPRIPKVAEVESFRAFVAAGRDLAALHIGYEEVEPYPLEESAVSDNVENPYRVRKMNFGKGKDRNTIIYNEHITLSGIPEVAYEYQLGSRSAIEWIIERYQVKTDKASGIINDPNDWCQEVGNPRYIIDLLRRIVTVSVETLKIVQDLPPIKFSVST